MFRLLALTAILAFVVSSASAQCFSCNRSGLFNRGYGGGGSEGGYGGGSAGGYGGGSEGGYGGGSRGGLFRGGLFRGGLFGRRGGSAGGYGSEGGSYTTTCCTTSYSEPSCGCATTTVEPSCGCAAPAAPAEHPAATNPDDRPPGERGTHSAVQGKRQEVIQDLSQWLHDRSNATVVAAQR